ncbi:MAG: cyclic nucleotide-binding domain-containing protein, partial [Hyphomicrobiales bacterium]
MREFMLDSDARFYQAGEVIFEKNDPGSSLFAIADGTVHVRIDANDPSKVVPIQKGSIFGEVGLISGRRRGATVVAAGDCICVEISRNAALNRSTTEAEYEYWPLVVSGEGNRASFQGEASGAPATISQFEKGVPHTVPVQPSMSSAT